MSSILYYILYAFFWVLTLLPLRVLYLISDINFLLTFYVFRYRRKIVRKNLVNSFPEKSLSEINKIERRFYLHLCDYFIETIKLIHMPYRTIRKRATYTNIEILDEYYKNKQSVILYLGHYGNWEWLSLAKYAQKSQIKDFMIYPVYHTLSNVAFDRLFINVRKNKNSIPVPQEKILRTMINEKRNNNAALYIFIADQSTSSGNIHYWTNFLNQDTPCISGAERIAKQTNYPVIYLDVTRVKRGHYNIELVPITDNPKELGEFELTEKYMRLMEKTIQRSPAYWLWTHNRWRHKRKKA